MCLSIDEGTKMQYNTLSLVPLPVEGLVCMLHGRELFLVSLALALELLCNLLLKNKGFESIVALLLGSRETSSKACGIVLLLIDKVCKPAILALVSIDLDLEILSFLGKLLGKSLEF